MKYTVYAEKLSHKPDTHDQNIKVLKTRSGFLTSVIFNCYVTS